ncbi:RSP_7527 family protein [Tropicimonas sp. S265A]|uniref:RSP_7527 family protein n=1 Tax=Tropicimonas sp. S265A TaxID=3415134 RepID=UPI003C7C967E
MKPQAYLTPEDLAQIEARAHAMRAQATAEALAAFKTWFRTHLTHRGAQKA